MFVGCQCLNIRHNGKRCPNTRRLYEVRTSYGFVQVCGGCRKNHIAEIANPKETE